MTVFDSEKSAEKQVRYNLSIEDCLKKSRFDEAWNLANRAVIDLEIGDARYCYYYEMSQILAREKKWLQALVMMGFWIYYVENMYRRTRGEILYNGLFFRGHEKHLRRLLKKFGREYLSEQFISLCLKTEPRQQVILIKKIVS